jgi:hypothetical protein
MNRFSRSLGAALSFLIATLALAQEHGPPMPPQEAVAACAGREAGASCAFQLDGHDLAGSCQAIPGGMLVACVPPHVFRGPPPEALEACKGQQEGAGCQFIAPRGETVAGVCRSGPQGEPPACMPKNARFHLSTPEGSGG